ncbi:DNRLRE domain-containing protein [Massilia sp. G4R7]|uniref:DNRLRE domain-containing protein n=1 Tax=Massilia phyllostachyos TaxID=2898585 RepID=A0ABS8Q9G2_9BURK|nr:polysaccharide lyase family 8 super-sandwich domain-containing protein [Massilia phyllostachyos]MCD2518396.1 DNRLRE domain-containing protein [Massilia phyllostachyos]
MHYKTIMRGLLAAGLLNAAWVGGAARADDYDDMRAKWALRGGAANAADPDVAALVAASQASAQRLWNTLDRDPGRTALWPDASSFAASATLTTSFTRLATLAGAYYSGNAGMQGNPELLAEVLAGIDWMLAHHYNAAVANEFDNWWDWQIGVPQQVNNLMFILYADQPAAQRAALIAAIDRFVPDPTRRTARDGSVPATATVETGANLLDKAWVVAMRGMLGKDGGKLAAGRDAVAPALPYVNTGDGFYADGSFVQHLHTPYVGGYGAPLLTNIGRLYYLLDGSPWEVTDPNRGVVFDWAMRAFRPFIYDGAMMDNQRGRSIARQTSTDHLVGRSLVGTMLNLTDSLPAGQADEIKSVLKGWMARDTSFGASYFSPVPINGVGVGSGLSATDVTRLKAILEDDAIVAADEPVETRVYAAADRVVQRRPGHAFALSMFSRRMSSFENGNGENLKGWWSGAGMTSLYNADALQYAGDYWATVDMWRLAGITTDHSGSGTPVPWKFYGNIRAGVGGAELGGQFATAAMEFHTQNLSATTLGGKKAWFYFGDKMVATGAAISSTSGAAVETIVENRKLNADGSNVLTVDGEVQDAALGWSAALPQVSWAHLAGTVAGADIGYVFPTAPTVGALRERRSGRWSQVHAAGNTAEVADNYLSLALGHGVDPANASYAYIVLPGRSAAETAAFAADSGISILENSAGGAAVKDAAQGVTGLVFWNDGSKTISAGGQPLVTSDKKAVVMLKQAGTDLQVSVADPTQTNTGLLNVEINRAAQSVLSLDPGVTVVQASPTIKLQLAVAGALGKSFAARFALSGTSSLAPAADAFLRDGSYGNTNYGSTNTLTVKADAVGYARNSMLKFDLSSVEGTITGASLRLTPVAAGMGGIVHHLYLTAPGWDEATVTWNNRPANGAPVASWTVPAIGTQMQVDVTAQAQAASGGGKQLSFAIEAAQNYGANGSVDYAARSHATAGYRPVLVVTVQ